MGDVNKDLHNNPVTFEQNPLGFDHGGSSDWRCQKHDYQEPDMQHPLKEATMLLLNLLEKKNMLL